jgi:hypothetical protein
LGDSAASPRTVLVETGPASCKDAGPSILVRPCSIPSLLSVTI